VPIRTFNDWHDPPPAFCEVDMVAHVGTSVAGSFIQTLTIVDVATGWTECMPLVTRESGLVVQAMGRAQILFPWLIRDADFDNDSAFMNDVVVPWCQSALHPLSESNILKLRQSPKGRRKDLGAAFPVTLNATSGDFVAFSSYWICRRVSGAAEIRIDQG
jgi:hypothetical protein